MKHSHPSLANGEYSSAENDNSHVFSFYRILKGNKVIVVVNLSGEMQRTSFKDKLKKYKSLFGENKIVGKEISLKPYEIVVGEVK